MARTPPTKPPVVDLENTAPPASTFEPFEWTPKNDLMDNQVAAIKLCELVDRVKDVASAAALVFDLVTARELDIEAEIKPYLSEHQISLLQRMARRSLLDLDEHAEELLADMNKLAGGNV
jgi:phage FluMu protein gp41